MVLCKNCNHELNEPTNTAQENRGPCPFCGSMSRLFKVQTGGSIAPSGRLVGRKLSNDGTEAIRVADSQKRASATDLDTSGQLSYAIEGVSPRGEEVVIHDFQKRHGAAVRALGFQAIWVVGPLAELTRRLDP